MWKCIGVWSGVWFLSLKTKRPLQDARRALLLLVAAVGMAPAAAQSPAVVTSTPQPTAFSSVITLGVAELSSVLVNEVERVAVGDPLIVDVTVVSPNEVLIKGLRPGTTNLILWDRDGQHVTEVRVIDRGAEELEAKLTRLLAELNVPGVKVKREGQQFFLVGAVPRQDDVDRLEQMISAFPNVTNLVTMSEGAAVGPPPTNLVKLSVQVVEISRSDLESLGVDWSDSVNFIEQSFFAGPGGEADVNTALTDFGASVAKRFGEPFRVGRLFRQGISATINALVQENRARLLAEPKLVTASGKEASSFVGVEVPYLSTSSTGTGTGTVSIEIEFKKTGVLLTMTPLVDPDKRRVTTTLEAEVSSLDAASGLTVPVGSSTVLVPGFKVRKANTEVATNSGETIIIAGLLELEDSQADTKVPGFSRVPFLGRLFRSPQVESSKRELVITVTPEVLPDEQAKEAERSLALEEALDDVQRYVLAEGPAEPPPQPPADSVEQVWEQFRAETDRRRETDGGGDTIPPADTDAASARSSAADVQRLAVTEVTLSGEDPRLRYALQIHDLIAQALRYPELEPSAAAASAQPVRLRLRLLADGTLDDAVVAASSGIDALDAEALRAAQEQAPYPPFPEALDQPVLEVDIPILFGP